MITMRANADICGSLPAIARADVGWFDTMSRCVDDVCLELRTSSDAVGECVSLLTVVAGRRSDHIREHARECMRLGPDQNAHEAAWMLRASLHSELRELEYRLLGALRERGEADAARRPRR